MYEYTIININTNEEAIIFGRTEAHAFAKAELNANEWRVVLQDYVD